MGTYISSKHKESSCYYCSHGVEFGMVQCQKQVTFLVMQLKKTHVIVVKSFVLDIAIQEAVIIIIIIINNNNNNDLSFVDCP